MKNVATREVLAKVSLFIATGVILSAVCFLDQEAALPPIDTSLDDSEVVELLLGNKN